MRVIIVKDKAQMGQVAGEIVAEQMQMKEHFVLGLATGSTPIPLYQELIRLHKEEGLDFSTTVTFNLDEYVGLDGTHEQSYRFFMNRELFDHININKKATHVPDGVADDIELACLEYESMISDCGGVDCQVLGIGSNGHIGFNEPGTSLGSRTHKMTLTRNTIKDNSRWFDETEDVPTEAVTMGIGTILEAESVVLLASGANKANVIAEAIEGPITATCPGSALQLHPNVTFVLTEDAATELKLEWDRG